MPTTRFNQGMGSEHQPRLAVVEDSDEDFALFRRALGGASITRWTSGEAALEALEADGFDVDVLVVDLQLPGIDGCEFVKRTRDLEGGTQPAICILSGSAQTSDMRRAQLAGADGYLVKPRDLAGLRELPQRLAEIAAQR